MGRTGFLLLSNTKTNNDCITYRKWTRISISNINLTKNKVGKPDFQRKIHNCKTNNGFSMWMLLLPHVCKEITKDVNSTMANFFCRCPSVKNTFFVILWQKSLLLLQLCNFLSSVRNQKFVRNIMTIKKYR